MANQSDLLCFQCGQNISDPPTIHELPGGGNCPGCVDRVLAGLPALLPSDSAEEPVAEGALGEDASEFADAEEPVASEGQSAHVGGQRPSYEPPEPA